MSAMSEPALEEMSRADCLDFLSRYDVGRVAVSTGEGPLVVPVNYILDGESVIFRSDPGTKIDLMYGGPVSFQLDQIDPRSRTGWSVLVQGMAEPVPAASRQSLRLESWAPGEKEVWIRIAPRSITGRRVALPAFVRDLRAYL